MRNTSGLIFSIFLFIAFFAALWLIIRGWITLIRGLTQLSIFVAAEFAFICNKGIPCENCLLSFGICPIGTVQRIIFIKHPPFYGILILMGIIGILLGTLTCGWVCPVGFIQDLLNTSRIKKIKLPNNIKMIRYIILAILALAIFLELDSRFFSKRGMTLFNDLAIVSGFLFLFSAFFINRPFCRMLCPIGFVYGKLNKISPIKVVLNRCKGCGECNKVCVVGIKPVNEVNSDLCVKCFNCHKVCNQINKL